MYRTAAVCTLVLLGMTFFMMPAPGQAAGGPVVLFTDLSSGPRTGGPGNMGAPISIFGMGFGSTRGSSRVTIGGVEVTSYLVWGSHNAHNPALDMLVVQPGAAVTGGAIVVTVNGQGSNTDSIFMPNNGSVYYISPTGSDAAACSLSAPCRTIQHTLGDVARPGDLVLMRNGTYPETDIWIRGDAGQSGTASQRKTVKNHPNEAVFLSDGSRAFTVDADYITVSGLNFQNGKSLSAAGWANANQTGNAFIDNTFIGLISWDAINVIGNDHLVAGNVCSVSGSTVGTMGHCYYIDSSNNVKILYNIGSGAPGYQIHAWDEVRTTNDYQRRITNLLVEGNVLRNSPERSGMLLDVGDCAAYYGGRCYGNYVDGVIIRNNVFTANNHAGLIINDEGTAPTRNVKIYGNTFYQNGRQGIFLAGSSRLSGIDLQDNLIYQTANANCIQPDTCSWFPLAHIQAGAAIGGLTIRNNFYAGSPTIIDGVDTSPVTGQTTFANAGALDFHLLAGSAAIDQGVALADLPRDFDTTSRPQGSAFDIGAFEYSSTGPDLTPPALSNGLPRGTLPAGTTSTTLSVGTNEAATCRFAITSGIGYAAMNTFAATGTTTHTQSITGLVNGQNYTYYVRCRDGSNNTNPTDYAILFSVGVPDALPPSAPVLTANGQSSTQISLTWTAALDNIGVAGYRIVRNGSPLATTTARNYIDSGLTPNVTYAYVIVAFDAAGNSNTSNTAPATTFTAPVTANDSSLVGYWTFDENTGTRAADASASGAHGTLEAAVLWNASGFLNAAVTFPGQDAQHVTIGTPAALANLTRFTYTTWVLVHGNNHGGGGEHAIIEKGMGSDSRKFLHLTTYEGSNLRRIRAGVQALGGGAVSESATGTYPASTWFHVAVTYDDTGDRRMHLYLNGSEVTYALQIATSGALTDDSLFPLVFGAVPGSTFQSANLTLDEVRIYRRALSAQEISAVFAGSGSPPNQTSFPRRITIALEGAANTTTVSGMFSVLMLLTQLLNINFTTNASGSAVIMLPPNLPSPADLRINVPGYLSALIKNVNVTEPTLLVVAAPQLVAGDFNSDDTINSLDWGIMNRNWFGMHALADINRDGIVNSIDFSFLTKNWLAHGP